jgi:hypothetical protein
MAGQTNRERLGVLALLIHKGRGPCGFSFYEHVFNLGATLRLSVPFHYATQDNNIRLRARRARANVCIAMTLSRSSRYFLRSWCPRNAAWIRVAAFHSRML